MVKQVWFLIVALPLFVEAARGTDFHYQQQDSITVYVASGETPEILSRLPAVNYPDLHRIVDLSHKNETRLLADINPDKYDCDDDNICQHAYLSDGRFILWAGKILQNQEDKPRVDVASFQAFGPFAADKRSLYFDGERTDDNTAEKRVDMATLEKTDIWNLLRDKNNLYFKGHWLGSNQGFRVLRQQSATDFIVLTAQQVIVDGVPLAADASTFHIVRWMPGERLIYRDKDGEHEYVIDNDGQGCGAFNIGLNRVTWLKHEQTNAGSGCKVATLADVDPEYFYRLNPWVAWYKNHLYLVKINTLGEGELRILTPEELPPILPALDERGRWYNSGNLSFSVDGQLYRHISDDVWQRYNPTSAIWTTVSQTPTGLIPF